MEAPVAATDEPPRSPPSRRPATTDAAAALLGNETISGAGLGWAAAVDDGPVLALDTPDEAMAEGQIESFFDDMAFQAVEPAPRGGQEPGAWSVQDNAQRAPPPLPSDASGLPIGVVDDDDIPVVMGNVDAAGGAPAPQKNDPFSGLDWVVGEPGKK